MYSFIECSKQIVNECNNNFYTIESMMVFMIDLMNIILWSCRFWSPFEFIWFRGWRKCRQITFGACSFWMIIMAIIPTTTIWPVFAYWPTKRIMVRYKNIYVKVCSAIILETLENSHWNPSSYLHYSGRIRWLIYSPTTISICASKNWVGWLRRR